MTSISDLIEMCEIATGPDREIDHLFQVVVCNNGHTGEYDSVEAWVADALELNWNSPRFTASLDAIVGLIAHESGIGSVEFGTSPCSAFVTCWDDDGHDWQEQATAPTPPLALCLAFLRTKAAAAPEPRKEERT